MEILPLQPNQHFYLWYKPGLNSQLWGDLGAFPTYLCRTPLLSFSFLLPVSLFPSEVKQEGMVAHGKIAGAV